MNYAQLVSFADNLTSACPVDKDGKTTLDVIRYTIMEHPHFFPEFDPRMEHSTEEAKLDLIGATACADCGAA